MRQLRHQHRQQRRLRLWLRLRQWLRLLRKGNFTFPGLGPRLFFQEKGQQGPGGNRGGTFFRPMVEPTPQK